MSPSSGHALPPAPRRAHQPTLSHSPTFPSLRTRTHTHTPRSTPTTTTTAKILISDICSRLDVDGLRGDIVINRAAKALVALEGRSKVEVADVERIITGCLNHRRVVPPLLMERHCWPTPPQHLCPCWTCCNALFEVLADVGGMRVCVRVVALVAGPRRRPSTLLARAHMHTHAPRTHHAQHATPRAACNLRHAGWVPSMPSMPSMPHAPCGLPPAPSP